MNGCVYLRTVQTLTEPEDISMSDINLQPTSHLPATVRVHRSPTACCVQQMWPFDFFFLLFCIKKINKSHDKPKIKSSVCVEKPDTVELMLT